MGLCRDGMGKDFERAAGVGNYLVKKSSCGASNGRIEITFRIMK